MTDEILTSVERLRFDELPTSFSADDMVRYFTLSKGEIEAAQKCRGAENQVGFALQFCALRMIGRFPTDLKQVPIEVINYLASQLDVASFKRGLVICGETKPPVATALSSSEFNYPLREQTKWDHAEKIRKLTQFELFDQEAMNQLSVALREQALQCNQSQVLMAFAREKLYRNRSVRPTADTLERLIAQIKKQVEEEIFSFIYAQLDENMKQTFEKLLVVKEESRFSSLQLFKKPPPAASPNALLALLRQIDTIREIGINKLDFSPLSENKVKYLAKLGKGYSTSPMLRFKEPKRYSLLACFLRETLTETTDTAIDMYDALITSVIRRSQNDLDDVTTTVAKETNERVILFKDIGSVLLDSEISDQLSEFYLIIIPNNLRESTFVLDGLLNNETDLNPQQHFTDEHGYTENVFALASLLGFRFCPRFKDWGDKKISKRSDEIFYSNIEPLFHEQKTNRVRVINTSLMIEQWDNIVHLVASLKNRKVTASLLIQKMSTYSRAGRLIKAIQEVGRLFQTLYILEYIDNPTLRGEVRLHLSRHESAKGPIIQEAGEIKKILTRSVKTAQEHPDRRAEIQENNAEV